MGGIALFGGTFDPLHYGHLRMLETLAKQTFISSVIIIPNYIAPHKAKSRTPAKDRSSMVKATIKALSKKFPQKSFKVSEFEIKKQSISWTIDTVNKIKNTYSEQDIYFVIGSDSYFAFHTWKDYLGILGIVKLIVVNRHNNLDKAEYRQYYEKHLKTIPFNNLVFLEHSAIEISATELRQMLKKGQDISEFVPNYIADYIKQRGLYR
ncbi:nicotinate (nicotinamide) nucleotide adenylyltransferase [Candidatus Margulisiibacteriota bacterium]